MSGREENIVREFLDSFIEGDVAVSVNYLAEDASYYFNAWHEPITGVETLRADFERQAAGWSGFHYDLLNIASTATVVLIERIDRGQSQGKDLAVHTVGVFEIDEAGKISSWRDYWDPKEVETQRAG